MVYHYKFYNRGNYNSRCMCLHITFDDAYSDRLVKELVEFDCSEIRVLNEHFTASTYDCKQGRNSLNQSRSCKRFAWYSELPTDLAYCKQGDYNLGLRSSSCNHICPATGSSSRRFDTLKQ